MYTCPLGVELGGSKDWYDWNSGSDHSDFYEQFKSNIDH